MKAERGEKLDNKRKSVNCAINKSWSRIVSTIECAETHEDGYTIAVCLLMCGHELSQTQHGNWTFCILETQGCDEY